jgi:hypothetical protein
MKCTYCNRDHGEELKWLYKGGVAYINDPVLQTCKVLRELNNTKAGDYLQSIFETILEEEDERI